MFSIIGLLTGLSGPITAIANTILELQLKKAQAKSNVEIAQINADIEEAQGRRAILIAEAGHRLSAAINASARLLAASGPISYVTKLFMWDKVIGAFYGCTGQIASKLAACTTFRTDPLDANQWMIVGAIYAFYFGYEIMNRRKK